jgi:undecaprenyl phosphate-alpha-L-ara4FN deformylase
MELGLRIDVDTYSGTRLGVPNLCALLAKHGILGTFFFSVGPDNMGRHLWRLLRPAFLLKMLRTRAASLYGWDILLRGTVVPGPVIGRGLGSVIRAAADAGHEIGFHSWDHHAWQSQVASLPGPAIADTLRRGVELLTLITGRPPTCSASPAWRCTDQVLLEKLQFPFEFNSDCRGDSLFAPVVGSRVLPQPQVPTTLPTYDEVLGRNGVRAGDYNDFLLSRLRPGRLNTLTIHAEAEGILCRDLFAEFLQKARAADVRLVPLGRLVQAHPRPFPSGGIIAGSLPGREGWISLQRNGEAAIRETG